MYFYIFGSRSLVINVLFLSDDTLVPLNQILLLDSALCFTCLDFVDLDPYKTVVEH
jgi:hypothetical protein